MAAALPIIGYGLIFNVLLCIPGVIMLLWGIYGWVFEPADDPDKPHGHGHDGHEGGHDGDGGGGHAELPAAADESGGGTAAASEEAPVG